MHACGTIPPIFWYNYPNCAPQGAPEPPQGKRSHGATLFASLAHCPTNECFLVCLWLVGSTQHRLQHQYMSLVRIITNSSMEVSSFREQLRLLHDCHILCTLWQCERRLTPLCRSSRTFFHRFCWFVLVHDIFIYLNGVMKCLWRPKLCHFYALFAHISCLSWFRFT